VSDFRQRGILPEAMVNELALLGWGPPAGVPEVPLLLEDLVRLFRIEDVNPSPAFFDVKKLEAINGDYLRALSPEEFVARVEPFLVEGERSRPVLRELASEVQTRVRTLAEAEGYVDFLWRDELELDDAAWTKAMKDERAASLLDAMVESLASCEWTADAVREALEHAGRAAGYVRDDGEVQLAKAQAPVRVALTGRGVGPPLFESVVALGRDRSLARLREARARL
jgi:glutamyl-tRNA synthetase